MPGNPSPGNTPKKCVWCIIRTRMVLPEPVVNVWLVVRRGLKTDVPSALEVHGIDQQHDERSGAAHDLLDLPIGLTAHPVVDGRRGGGRAEVDRLRLRAKILLQIAYELWIKGQPGARPD